MEKWGQLQFHVRNDDHHITLVMSYDLLNLISLQNIPGLMEKNCNL